MTDKHLMEESSTRAQNDEALAHHIAMVAGETNHLRVQVEEMKAAFQDFQASFNERVVTAVKLAQNRRKL